MGISSLVIVNTAARNVRIGGRWTRCESDAMRRLAPAELAAVSNAPSAEDAAWQGAMSGFGRFVVVGDLATSSAVVNGLMRLSEDHRRSLKVGFLCLGRPNAWCRALDIAQNLDRQLEILSAANVLPYDVGQVNCLGPQHESVTRYFLSGTALGFSGQPGTADATVIADGEVIHRGPWNLGFAMQTNQYPGMGMISPQAVPSDGLLNLAWADTSGFAGRASGLMATLLHLPVGFNHMTAHELRLAAREGTQAVHVDGALVGTLPATITVVPRTLPVIVEAIGSRLREKQRALLSEVRGAALAGHFHRTHAR